jgi:sugar phosphate permease
MAIGWWITPISFYILFGIGRVIFAAPVQIGTGTVVSQWFIRRRGRANGILGSTHSVGMGLMPFFAQILINTVGWREAWFWLGITVWLVALAPLWALMISRPEDVGLKPDGDGELEETETDDAQTTVSSSGAPEPEGWTLRDAIRTPALWIVGLSGGLLFFVHASVNIHQAERLPVRFAYAGVGLFLGVVALLFLIVDNTLLAFVVATLFGFGLGGLLVVPSVVVADYFGRRSLGAVRGFIEPWTGGGQAAGALGAGLIFDMTGDYQAVFPVLTAFAIVSALLILLTPAPRKTAIADPASPDSEPAAADD